MAATKLRRRRQPHHRRRRQRRHLANYRALRGGVALMPKRSATSVFLMDQPANLAMRSARASALATVLRGARQHANHPWVAVEAAGTPAAEAAAALGVLPGLDSEP